ncbi:fumarylacetoacetate (FAA) hydrolase family protein [Burkholderia ambifaria AMMD]|uniref:5-oxopent-3-ene-1,2,5-tricarboxylate decarboxylase n=1 Tax=Burkholderia ambifaria (strain ATCC BAA-244 / DSM 16087 / CCUG 44356 / LMG 19182 / AMMD) TaxID=339670 RepID=Q0B7L5_BURCM|nr:MULTISPECIES: fumarylacetoacetate hydrolase family protein [Burkholderia]ABI89858.1 5-oxopent-3-ene-1,2,5-tricarboxylate decarboxylase [Burkholderia ambifaria AMMD]AJY24364.1 fumarylacetoacetate (FAA) hydrolase family protein [Burkholderia ambifaria AMMD]MBR7930400.1 fumarylacetoacetate hydrolase family protein [Burkholderia ambifaria]PEH67955.1 FAA hydrolase family protein [Burkholderia ambifaria]QQC07494.1 fumarylacetoacetate hydrolase family protein [Burkholderia ambifaria]
MKLITFKQNGDTRLGVLDGSDVIDLNRADPAVPADLRAALEAGVDVVAAARNAATRADVGNRIPLSEVELAPVVPKPGKIVCLGHNFYDHAKEGGNLKPVYPLIFFRGATSLIAHGDPVIRPFVSEKLDYEAELVVVIGKTGRHVKRENALDHVFGYACFNDVSVRDYQKRTAQWTIGKNFDGTGAFGPWLVTSDELPPGAAGLKLELRLNGEAMQRANTADMIWSVAETIELLTECLTLEPGDVVVMGTPAGVGFARTPPVWMKAGDRVEVDIEGIGVLSNVVQDEAAAQ